MKVEDVLRTLRHGALKFYDTLCMYLAVKKYFSKILTSCKVHLNL
jgi:hypothetical protein